jgi:glycosyltransferase involved in cell wall biosynthesis
VRIAFFGDASHPNASGWMDDLSALMGIEVHAVDFSASSLCGPSIRQHQLATRVAGKMRYLMAGAPLRRLLRAIRPDIVLAYRVTSYGFAAARSGVRPLVLAAQGQNIVSVESPVGSAFCARYALSRADLIHAWASHMAQAMERLGADPARIQVLHRGVRTDVFHPDRERQQPLRLITSRQLAAYYRTDLVIRAVSTVRAGGTPLELWVAGEGPERASLEQLVGQLGLSGAVRFLGRLPTQGLAEAYRQCSLYASMVPTDGVSSSLLEAMSAELYPFAIDNEANRAWIQGNRGALVVAGDPLALAKAITCAIAAPAAMDAARRANRARVVAEADRTTNLRLMLSRWGSLVTGAARTEGASPS